MSLSLTVMVPCRNEAPNLVACVGEILPVVEAVSPAARLVFIDNASTDESPKILRQLAESNPRIGVIFNRRNFGHVRSPYYGLLQMQSDAVIVMPADLQVPASLIPEFLKRWGESNFVVLAQRTNSEEGLCFRWVRRTYYRVMLQFAEIELLENTPGWGLYDRRAIELFRSLDDPYPYVRGLVSDLGLPVATVPYSERNRSRGLSKNNFYTLFDVAMLAMTSHSKVPLRLATILGFGMAAVFGAVGFAYLVYKLLFWDRFTVGMAPVVIGLFFFASVQLFFIGIIGEYIGAIYTKVTKRPLVVEKERINWPSTPAGPPKDGASGEQQGNSPTEQRDPIA
jgi:polyisoprenyl-phosphate glycosyltransferase